MQQPGMDKLSIGSPAPSFEGLPGVDGKSYSLGDFADKELLVVVFGCNHCPYVQATVGRLVELQEEFGGRGVQFVMINSNDAENYPEDSFEKMKEWAQRWGLNFPYLRDESQEVARAYKAVRTPEVFVFDRKRELRFHGPIDDNWQDPSKVSKRYLRDALSALLEGNDPPEQEVHAVGCTIKWKTG